MVGQWPAWRPGGGRCGRRARDRRATPSRGTRPARSRPPAASPRPARTCSCRCASLRGPGSAGQPPRSRITSRAPRRSGRRQGQLDDRPKAVAVELPAPGDDHPAIASPRSLRPTRRARQREASAAPRRRDRHGEDDRNDARRTALRRARTSRRTRRGATRPGAIRTARTGIVRATVAPTTRAAPASQPPAAGRQAGECGDLDREDEEERERPRRARRPGPCGHARPPPGSAPRVRRPCRPTRRDGARRSGRPSRRPPAGSPAPARAGPASTSGTAPTSPTTAPTSGKAAAPLEASSGDDTGSRVSRANAARIVPRSG